MQDVLDHQLQYGDPSDTTSPKIGKPEIGVVSISGNDVGFGDVSHSQS